MDASLILGRYRASEAFEVVDKIAVLTPEKRRRHLYVVGGTGVGKSTLLLNIAAQDMARGDGLLLLDPHGDLAEAALDLVPPWRSNQVCYLNLPDLAHPVGLNVLEDTQDADDRAGIADGVVSAMRAAWPDSWGPRMEHILRHALLALIATEGASLAMLPRFLTDQSYRSAVLTRLDDPFLRAFFVQEFERWSDRFREEAVAPILNKIGGFLAFPAIRHVLGQWRSSLDLAHALARGRIVIVNLAKGLIGETAAQLMGALLIGCLKAAALARARLPAQERRDFHLIVDEAQNFTTEAMAVLLSEARKYGITLTLANQHLAQLPEALRAAILGNAGALVVFRVGAEDACLLAAELSLEFEFSPAALQNLVRAEAKLLYDPADRGGVRRWALGRLKNAYARGEFERLHHMQARDFHAEVVGPSNRLNDFLSSDALRLMLGQTERVLDLKRILDDGHILLVDLQDGRHMSGANARLLGAILLRYLFFFASRRANTRRPTFLVIDECQRFLSGDIPTLLAEARKFGIGVTLAHQYLAQLGEPGDQVREAILNCTNVKAVFRVKDPTEAQQLAETVVPLNLEAPISILTKPAAAGQEVVQLRCWSHGRNSSETSTVTTSEGVADMAGQSESVGAGSFNAAGLTDVFDMGAGGMTAMPAALTQAFANSSGASETRGAATMHATTRSFAKSFGEARSEGRSQSESATETFKTIYKDMPGAVHSLDNLRYMAAEAIRRLPSGAMFCAWAGRAAHVTTPLVTDEALPELDMNALIARVLAASEFATPASEALAAVEARRARIVESPVSPPPAEPDFLSREPMLSPLGDEWVEGFWDRVEERKAAERDATDSANDNEPVARR